MRYNYTLSDMPIIDFDLAKNLSTKIDEEINSLKHSDLKTEEGFAAVLKRLQQKVDLNPVEFSKPEIVDHRTEEKQVRANYYSPIGGTIKTNIITVKVGYQGSEELFKYKPNGFSFTSNNIPVVHQPAGDAVYLDIEHGDLGDKDGILKKVQDQMSVTYDAISSNNNYVNEGWRAMMKSSVEQKLTQYKQKLDNLYGG